MRFSVLGPLEVTAGSTIVPIAGLRQRRIIATLALAPNSAVSTGLLVDVLWGQSPPRTAREQVQNCVGHAAGVLREYTGDALIVRRRDCYTLHVEGAAVDASAFRAALTRARELERQRLTDLALEVLREGLGLWRGDPLLDVRTDALQPQIVHLEELRVSALEQYGRLSMGIGDHVGAIAELTVAVSRDPLNERLAELLIRCLHRAGRTAQALRVYDETREVLAAELGASPGPNLRRLRREILTMSAAEPRGATGPRAAAQDTRDDRPDVEVNRLLTDAVRLLRAAVERMPRSATVDEPCASCGGPGRSDTRS